MHWFDFDKFYGEVTRVANFNAVFAAWSYGLFSLNNPPMGKLLNEFYHDIVGPYWPPESGVLFWQYTLTKIFDYPFSI